MVADGIASRFNSVAYPADAERQIQAIMAMPLGGTSFTRARPGVRPGGGLTVTVDSTGAGTATVLAGGGIITDPGAGAGSYIFATSTKNLALPARPGAGTSRIDEVIAHILNVDERAGDGAGNRFVEIYLLSGAASASPVAPAIPAGQLRLAELTVPSAGAISVSKQAQRITGLGGVLKVATLAERDAIIDPQYGDVIYVEDYQGHQVRLPPGIWADVVIKVDTGWLDLPLNTGWDWTVQKPQYRYRNGLVHTRGFLTKTAGIAASTAYTAAAAPIAPGGFPAGRRPASRHDAVLSGNSAPSSCRAFVDTDGSLALATGGTAPSFVCIDALSGFLTD